MAHRIVMPSFGMYTAEGNLGRWFKPAGSRVEAGELIADLVTEKATYELESPAAGLLHPIATAGESLQVEGLIGWILADGEAPPAAEGDATVGLTAPESGRRGAEAGPSIPPLASTSNTGSAAFSAAGRLRASPLARRVAAEHAIDLHTLTGSGPSGRIVEADVQEARARRAGAALAPNVPWRVRERLPLTGARKTIGERLRRSLDSAVSLTLTREARAEALVAGRGALASSLAIELPFDALLLKVFAAALRERPELNAVIAGGEILLLDEIHLGFAVSVPASADGVGGLVVPVVRDADLRPLGEVAREVRQLAQRARAGTLRPQDVLGGTATITNLGNQAVDAFTPVLNPPQSVILGIGRIAQRPVVDEGRLAIGTTCVLSLTFDHRVVDGAPAAHLLAAIARRLNDPAFYEGLA